jgi:hypothetical protein
MESLQSYLNEYKKQMEKGTIQKAYQGLMEYILDLRTYFNNRYPDHFVSGNIYYGYMDMSYFAISPESLKNRKLKIALVFIHKTLTFEVWLAGYNKQVQLKYSIAPTTKGLDYILACTLVENPNFNDLAGLTKQIEKETLNFISEIENFLSKH